VTTLEQCQEQLLAQSIRLCSAKPLTEATIAAFRAVPRHRFLPRCREWGSVQWIETDEANLAEHAAALYANKPLVLFGDDDDNVPSTISQPSLVLQMLDMLRLEPGQRVFELGAGSGWNAALMAHLVGPEGRVVSLDIIPEVARQAAENVAAMGIKNLEIVAADGCDGHPEGAPYDRAVFTAGSMDLPSHFYTQIKEDGLLQIVIRMVSGADSLFLLRKTHGHFESIDSIPVAFVPVTGKHRDNSLEPVELESLPEWEELREKEVSRTPFWWGGKGGKGAEASVGLHWRSVGIRSFLGITEPLFRSFKAPKANGRLYEERFFGLCDQENGSLAICRDDQLVAYGNSAARDRLLRHVHQWVDLGMPAGACFTLNAYPSDYPLSVGENQWIVRRRESQFLWSLLV
jgi:protein-L-isoaspartate(D-aspartate) O-methyltransferase